MLATIAVVRFMDEEFGAEETNAVGIGVVNDCTSPSGKVERNVLHIVEVING